MLNNKYKLIIGIGILAIVILSWNLITKQIKAIKAEKIQQEEIKKAEEIKSAEILKTMQDKIIELENKKPEVVTKTITKRVEVPVKDGYTAEEVIAYWKNKTAFVVCGWNYEGESEFFKVASGSGMLTSYVDGTVGVVTNYHVVNDKGYGPNVCKISIPNYQDVYVTNTDITHYENGIDLAVINITYPTQDLINTGSGNPACFNDVNIGEKLVVLGYPGTGSYEGITATEGIISGTEGSYYITSAKIEHGNSGGLAISLKNNCYIGIPTYSIIGGAESLGRILSSSYIFSN